MNPRMSSLVTRPPAPVPGITDRSAMPLSRAILRTSGDERTLWDPLATAAAAATGAGDTGAGAAGGAAGTATGAGAAAAGVGAGAGGAGGAATGSAAGAEVAAPAPPILATTVLTSTVAPSSTMISARTPLAGAGTSASTLSVEISKSGSSLSTVSPACLNQRVRVPSAMDSPICGIGTSVRSPLAAAAGAGSLAAGAAAGAGSATGCATGSGAGASSAATGAAPAPSPLPRMATTVFTSTVAPSSTMIFSSTPSAGAGTSASTLSVEISKSGSSRWITSPGCLNQRVRVPSAIDSPIWGISTSVAIMLTSS